MYSGPYDSEYAMTRTDRQLLLSEAEYLLFELALAEPSGSTQTRALIVEKAKKFLAEMRTLLLPNKRGRN
jgi:hypothetical protein